MPPARQPRSATCVSRAASAGTLEKPLSAAGPAAVARSASGAKPAWTPAASSTRPAARDWRKTTGGSLRSDCGAICTPGKVSGLEAITSGAGRPPRAPATRSVLASARACSGAWAFAGPITTAPQSRFLSLATIGASGPVPEKPTAKSWATAASTGMPRFSSEGGDTGPRATIRVLSPSPPHEASAATARTAAAHALILRALNGTVVMKFGGTSVADAERIKRAAGRIVAKKEAGHRVVAVLSARGKETDRLIADAFEISSRPDPREMDMLLSTGERQSCALCAMAINDLGHRAISLTGSQAGIVTDTSHTKARILEVRADRIREGLDEDQIVLVAGFQGVSTSRDVTTLGRGGSDTTAVALAAAVGADECEIYTDVPGVFSADPRLVPDARKLRMVSFEEMLEMAASGAGVLQLRSVEYARNHGVRIHCRSSFDDAPGTVVVGEDITVEQPSITAVTHSTGEARITLVGIPDEPGIAGRVTTALADANVNIDMIVQNEPRSAGSRAEMSFTVPRDDLHTAQSALSELNVGELETDEAMGKVSVVGAGMKTHPGVAAKVFETLGANDINIEMISTSPIRISCVIRGERVPDAVRALHTAFELSGPDTIRPERPFGEFR